ncbi:MAG: glycosyl hydrolase family protein [Balneolaceae bacterium]|nr:MAG: glycosyl hydrolase family protein [Balneolaceae bacterium]
MNYKKNAFHVLMCVLFTGMLMGKAHAQSWQLVWSDEFDGEELDESKWSYQYGTGTSEGLTGWGNNELQYYTDREENVFVKDGKLHIVARDEIFGGSDFTSARIRTINKGDWRYGKFEIRAKMPIGQGIWPAIWMMPTDNVYGGWAASGEIDIMEYLGHQPERVHGTLHYGGESPNNVHTGTHYDLPSGNFHEDFHTFTLEWEDGVMRWYVNGEHYQTQNDWYSQRHPYPAPFDEYFHLIMNVAVGGNWPGHPDQNTEFPQTMVVDYVRVYEYSEFTSAEDERHEGPGAFELHQNHPNPFNPATNISFSIPNSQHVTLAVYDMMGRRVDVLANERFEAGTHTVRFDAGGLSSGIYNYRISTDTFRESRSMIFLK